MSIAVFVNVWIYRTVITFMLPYLVYVDLVCIQMFTMS